MNRRGAVERRISMLAPRCFYKIEQIILGVNTLVKEKAVLEMKNIHKSFPGVRALQGVNFTLCEGEVHALMGENGAGKSTLIKVLTGVYGKDEGEIFLKGKDKAVAIHSPQDAQRLGISTVYQEITLCPNLSVAENMFIGRTSGLCQITITGYTGKGLTAAWQLLDRGPADDSHCPRR